MTPPLCNSLFGLIFGHRFEARYDIEGKQTAIPISDARMAEVGDPWMEDVLRASVLEDRKATYRCDVCIRCGEAIDQVEDPK